MNLNEWAKAVHECSKEHGWWDKELSFGDVIALCHSELSEALEAYRERKPQYYTGPDGKPEGIAVELIDCVIRILDYLAYIGWDVEAIVRAKHEYNKTRPYRHGGKRM